jgi:hypothetical protein
MARKYYTLIQRIDGRWFPQFGDYDRAVVDEERQGMRDAHDAPRASDLKVITTGPKQADINAAIEKLNAAAQPDRANQGGATPGASSVLADELDDQDPDAVEAFERSGPRSRPR